LQAIPQGLSEKENSMHILFIWPTINNSVATHLGLGHISSLLKSKGHKVSLIRIDKEITSSRIVRGIQSINPDLIGFSIVTNQWYYARKYARAIKRAMDTPVIAGGVHVTTNPEEVIREPSFDYLCIGEGEYPLLELAETLSLKGNTALIRNLFLRKNGKIMRNPPRQFIHELDSLPPCDVEMFFPQPARIENLEIMAGRGCPYNCTYCCNHALRKTYEDIDNSFIRYRSPENVIGEINYYLRKRSLPIKRVLFQDDIFTLNKMWLKDFCNCYRKKFSLPFTCNARVETIDEENLILLKDAGCDTVTIGVESGNEWLRTHVLKRKMTNRKIQETFDMAKKIGLGTYAFYILGFPQETKEMLEETYQFHLRLNPDRGFQIATFYPFPGTELWDFSKEHGLIPNGKWCNTFSTADTILELPIKKDIIKVYQKFYSLWKSLAVPNEDDLKTRHPQAYPLYRFCSLILGRPWAFRLFSWVRKITKAPLFIKMDCRDTA